MHIEEASEQQPLNILLFNQIWLAKSLSKLGHRVFSVGFDSDIFDLRLEHRLYFLEEILQKLPKDFQPTHVLYCDNATFPFVTGWERSNIPKLFYSVDTFREIVWHKYFGEVFDRLLYAQNNSQSLFAHHHDAHWFPLWGPTPPADALARDIPVAFRGTLDEKLNPNRVKFFNELSRLVPLDCGAGPFSECYRRAKIVVNQSIEDDVNFRTFEATTCGALLLTPKSHNGLEHLFIDGKEIVTYESNNARDAARAIRYYLRNEQERAQIAKRGQERVRQEHSAERRASDLVRHLRETQPRQNDHRLFALGSTHLHVTGTWLKMYRGLAIQHAVCARDYILRSWENESIDAAELQVQTLLCLFYLLRLGLWEAAEKVRERVLSFVAAGSLDAVLWTIHESGNESKRPGIEKTKELSFTTTRPFITR